MRHLIVGNWKMNKTATQAAFYLDALLSAELPDELDLALAPPFTALAMVSAMLRGTRVALGAQNMHWEPSGAYTGEIAADMLTDLGVKFVILGHSERREYFGETDAMVNKKIVTALSSGLTPIVCVGESLSERDAGRADERVTVQTRAALAGLGTDAVAKVVMAYEPIWAIGTGHSCDADEADATMATIRRSVRGLGHARILYGGSVKTENIADFASKPNVNGGLVGGASLDAEAFAALARAAHEGTQRG
jgi:triosephosphate isomerase